MPGRRIVKAADQIDQAGFAGAGGTYKSRGFPDVDRAGHVLECCTFLGIVTKGDIIEDDLFLDRSRHPRAAAQVRLIALVEKASDFLYGSRKGVERYPVDIDLFDTRLEAIQQEKESHRDRHLPRGEHRRG